MRKMRALYISQSCSANLAPGDHKGRAVVNIAANTKAAIDYQICTYPGSRLRFRGPARSLGGPYISVLGGSEAFGKFVERPFADLLEARVKQPVANFGVMQAGLTLFLDDPVILKAASAGRLTIIQILGAQNMSNRFYSVHPRRNDRFLVASETLQALYPGLDFTEFNFTGHLLATLEDRGGAAFDQVVAELRTAWVHRMVRLLQTIQGDCLLLWMAERAPDSAAMSISDGDPLFVDRPMLDALLPHASGLVEVVASRRAMDEGLSARGYLPGEEAAALALPGPRFHAEAADALADAILGAEFSEPYRTTSAPFVFRSSGTGGA